jgi:hypothetical protein
LKLYNLKDVKDGVIGNSGGEGTACDRGVVAAARDLLQGQRALEEGKLLV